MVRGWDQRRNEEGLNLETWISIERKEWIEESETDKDLVNWKEHIVTGVCMVSQERERHRCRWALSEDTEKLQPKPLKLMLFCVEHSSPHILLWYY